jgi:hypothetical protein
MKLFKMMLVGAGLSIALATAASAQSTTPEVGDGVAMVVSGTGSSGYTDGKAATARAAGHRTLMQQAARPKPGTLLYRSGSNLYLFQDAPRAPATADQPWQGWKRNF